MKYNIVSKSAQGEQESVEFREILSGMKRSIDASVTLGERSTASAELSSLNKLILQSETQLIQLRYIASVVVPADVLDGMQETIDGHQADREVLKLRISAIDDEDATGRAKRAAEAV